MSLKKLLKYVIIATLLILCAFPDKVSANEVESDTTAFRDIKADHWAYDAIMWMTERSILTGYGDHTFGPDNPVKRNEFSVMMVKALEINIYKPDIASFRDVPKSNTYYPYIESAKYYLTGYKSTAGDYFRPERPAVREDLAVALVKALGYAGETADESVLSNYNDSSKISPNIKKYVAIAIQKGIMEGYNAPDGKKEFGALKTLTRAEAAAILYRSIKLEDEKVTFDNEEKVTYEDNTSEGVIVTANTENGCVLLNWTKAEEEGFNYYKVVISKYNKSPAYPDDGYLYCITDRNTLSATITGEDGYCGGDFRGRLEPGQKYYFSVTYVYNDRKIKGNAVQLTFP